MVGCFFQFFMTYWCSIGSVTYYYVFIILHSDEVPEMLELLFDKNCCFWCESILYQYSP